MKNNILNILKKEIRETFRDKKSLSMMLVMPIMIPLLVVGMSALFDMQINKSEQDYNRIGFAYEMTEEEKTIAKQVGIDITNGTEEKIADAYNSGELDLYITKKDNVYVLNGSNNDTTSYASELAQIYFNQYEEYLQNSYLTEHNVNPQEVLNIVHVEQNILPEDNFFADYVMNYAFIFIIMAITVAATYPATDTTAGEKERGTLETLLTFPIKSRDIIVGKFLNVSLSSIVTGLLSFVLMIISLRISNDMFSIYEGVDLMLPPMGIVFSIVVIIAYSFLISGLCIAVASKSKTFKEAQSSLMPLMFICMFPGMIAFMIELKTTIVWALVPFMNYSLIFTDIVAGNANYLHIALMMLSTIVIIVAVLMLIIRQYKSEKILFSN